MERERDFPESVRGQKGESYEETNRLQAQIMYDDN